MAANYYFGESALLTRCIVNAFVPWNCLSGCIQSKHQISFPPSWLLFHVFLPTLPFLDQIAGSAFRNVAKGIGKENFFFPNLIRICSTSVRTTQHTSTSTLVSTFYPRRSQTELRPAATLHLKVAVVKFFIFFRLDSTMNRRWLAYIFVI